LKKFNLSIGWFSFLFTLSIMFVFSILSHLYMQESINTTNSHEEHLVACYANKITNREQSIEEFKKLIFGSLESFTHKIAIIDNNNEVLYSTFEKVPPYDLSKTTYFKDGYVYYNSPKIFSYVGTVKFIMGKKVDYSGIKKKSIILITSVILFIILCSLFLYYHIKSIYNNINKQLDAFFKDAIHEIRTPLGVVQINLDFLENTMESSMALKRAQGGLRNLSSVYESLEYSIKNKKVVYKKEHINLTQFIKNRIDFFYVLAEVKNIDIKSSIESDITAHISRVELQRLIDNNLSNAIKYSKENTQIEINLFIEDNFVYMKFSNFGEVIKNTNKIFNRFYRGDDINGGFGIGLNIVEYICRVYHIQVEVSSTQDGNTIFLYKFPPKIAKKDIA